MANSTADIEQKNGSVSKGAGEASHGNNGDGTNHFGGTAYFVLFLTCGWFASFVHTMLLILAYAPIFPDNLPFDRDMPLEIIGPALGYILAIYFIATSYGKVVDFKNFTQLLIIVTTAQILHFGCFWLEDIFLDKYRQNSLAVLLFNFVNGSSFLPCVCCYYARNRLKNDIHFQPGDSCLQKCLRGCCVCIGRLCFVAVFLPIMFSLLLGDNNASFFTFEFGNGDFGSSFDDEYDFGASQMSRRSALRSLNLGTGASMRDIKTSYRKLAKLYHPDKCGRDGSMSKDECETRFIKVQESYEYLQGKNKRKASKGFRI